MKAKKGQKLKKYVEGIYLEIYIFIYLLTVLCYLEKVFYLLLIRTIVNNFCYSIVYTH